ncbi:MAG: alanyl-tRNA editing protein [Candidatus Thorarchaeota archaeon]
MTTLLHMQDNYLRSFKAKVIKVLDDSVVLDRTAFYPEGGGQSGDRGTLSGESATIQITATRKEQGDIKHITKELMPFQVGDLVEGKLDWNWRYDCMRFHTAQHVLSRYLQIHYDLVTVGNMIKPGESRADYSPLDHFGEEMKRDVESGVNEILVKNLTVEIRFMPRTEATEFLNQWGYQKRYLEMVPKSVKEFRVLIIGDYDAASCAGTHVANTSEIGRLKLGKSKNVGAGKRRIYFKLE